MRHRTSGPTEQFPVSLDGASFVCHNKWALVCSVRRLDLLTDLHDIFHNYWQDLCRPCHTLFYRAMLSIAQTAIARCLSGIFCRNGSTYYHTFFTISCHNTSVCIRFGSIPTETPVTVASNAGGGMKNRDFRQISRYISEPIVTRTMIDRIAMTLNDP